MQIKMSDATLEIENLLENLKQHRRKYNEYKIIKDVAYECAAGSSTLNTELKAKVYDVLMHTDLQQYVTVTNNLGSFQLHNAETPCISFGDSRNINECVQEGIKRKSNVIIKELSKYGIKSEASNGINENDALFELKRTLLDNQRLYAEKLGELSGLLDQMLETRTKIIPQLTEKKIQECEIKTKVFELKFKILNANSNVNIFNETTESFQAYEQVMKDITRCQEECKTEIEHLKILKEKYAQVSCKQYDEILKSYLHYSAIADMTRRLKGQSINK